MRFLYVFPHPDDEAFGPSIAMSQQIRQGHDVALLTLTKGGATKERHRFNYSIEEMGSIRHQELKASAEVIGISELKVCDYPDGGLKQLDPRVLENEVVGMITDWQPEILISYAVHGISGHSDHLVCHAVTRQVFFSNNEKNLSLRRLALYTSPPPVPGRKKRYYSTNEEIDCMITESSADRQVFEAALNCYSTYQERISRSGIRRAKQKKIHFEIAGENFDPWLHDLSKALP